MSEIDPITRDALRRASRMQSNSRPVRREPARAEQKQSEEKPEPSAPPPEKKNPESGFGMLFGDSDRTLIVLMIILLMDSEDNLPLLLALFYLLT